MFELNTQIEAQPFPPIFTISLSKLQTAKCWRENLMHLSRKKSGFAICSRGEKKSQFAREEKKIAICSRGGGGGWRGGGVSIAVTTVLT